MDPSTEAGRKFGTEEPRALSLIAREIALDWKNPFYGAVPYINAMARLTTLKDSDGSDSAESIARYFLANAQAWRGGVARHIKAELKAMLKVKEQNRVKAK